MSIIESVYVDYCLPSGRNDHLRTSAHAWLVFENGKVLPYHVSHSLKFMVYPGFFHEAAHLGDHTTIEHPPQDPEIGPLSRCGCVGSAAPGPSSDSCPKPFLHGEGQTRGMTRRRGTPLKLLDPDFATGGMFISRVGGRTF
jgi:hypothetical protein